MQNSEAKNRDHNYSEVKSDGIYHYKYGNIGGTLQKTSRVVGATNKETIGGPIKDINELKKITPRVKLLAHDANSLSELTKINRTLRDKPVVQKTFISEQMRQELRKYCRTCAGLKLPLVDIFSEKGIQMRLSQQMKHLEDINEYDSLSTQMCMDCICDLKMSYKFFMQIKKAEMKLKSIHVNLTDAATKNMEKNEKCIDVSRNTSLYNKSNETPIEMLIDCLTNDHVNDEVIDLEPQTSHEPQDELPIAADKPQEIAGTGMQDEAQVEAQEEPETEVQAEVQAEVQTEDQGMQEILQESQLFQLQSDDNESIEEFDPDDPPFQPDSSEAAESDDEIDESNSMHGTKRRHLTKKGSNITQEETVMYDVINDDSLQNSIKQDLSQTVYKYDIDLKAYIKVETTDDENIKQLLVPKSEVPETVEIKEHIKQPNILKRKLSVTQRKEPIDANENTCPTVAFNTEEDQKDSKIPKLNLNNPLGVTNNAQEDGIMYVTVKGSKPNEILLVKVKKMEKPLEKKDDKTSGRRSSEFKAVDKVMKRYDALLMKDKDKPEKEQIIEEQIEEYKKKREKILGNHGNVLPASLKLGDSVTRFMKRSETTNNQKVSESSNVTTKTETDKDGNESSTAIGGEESDNVMEVSEEKPEDKPYNTEECISRLAKLKQKWEEAKKRKELLKQELDQSCAEGNIEKLTRILGEKEKNLQDFQEYLKQRKIVITRLKDEDIISLYEDRNNANMKKNLPDLIDETQPLDYIPEENYLECDYCIETFSSKEILEEHLKTHDYKIMHFCEDCMEEFPTNKAKRTHNVVCIRKLLCKYCDLMLDSKGKKRQHEQKHCDSMYGQLCDVCGEKFKHQGTLDQHVKTQHMNWEKIYQCPKCPKKFAFKQKLSFHLKSVHTTMRAYLCEDCGADFKNPASLRHHRIRKHQPVGNKRECPVCHKLVPFYSLSKHMHTHKAYTIQCPHCDKMFKNSSTLKQHVRIHEDQRQYRCDTCGVGFNRRDGLRLHMRVHEKTDSRGLKECSCQVCGEKFPNHSTLVIHRNRVHKDGRQYTCHICNRSMISTRSLEWHMSHIHNESLPGIVKADADGQPEKKRVSCYHCNKTFKTEMILRTHIKNTHMEKDPMKCLDCEMTFTSEVRLRHHMMVTHNRLEGTLPCPHCPKRFVNQLRLKTHMISHSEERPYTCEICGFNLKTKIQLIKHHQNRHSDERPLQCRYCPWRCKQVSALVCHERTHTNERPYSCSVCRQRFKYLGDKNKHERRHESLGGSGFKRIVPGRNIKLPKSKEEETSGSEQDHEAMKNMDSQIHEEDMQTDEQYDEKFHENEAIVKFEGQEISEEYEQVYEQEYEETSREASDAAEVIMNMEDTTVYTEEVTADNIETAEIMTDEIITDEILQSGTVVHLQQQDDTGKIQVIPVMLSLPDLTDASAEVNLATASIMYNN